MEVTSSFWIILTGSLVAGSCALLGCFLVLRRLSMLTDAISHAILPGIVIAFAVSASRASLVMFLGAVALGLITTFVVQYLSQRGVEGSAAIGVTFTSLFAVGVVLVSIYGEAVDLDLDCVLYGEIAYAPFDTLIMGGSFLGPRPVWINGALLLINLLVVGLFYKQFKICAFDPGMAAAVGINVSLMHYLLMGMVSVTTVGAFENVGVILVIALFVVPAATAYLLTDRLGHMLLIAVGAGVASSFLGYQLARILDCSIAGAIASAAGGMFVLAFLFSPRHGVLSRALTQWGLRRRLVQEDALLWVGRRFEAAGEAPFQLQELRSDQAWPMRKAAGAVRSLVRSGLLRANAGMYELTQRGRERTVELLRRHRLYEAYLHDLGYPTDHIHAPADRVEHHLSSGLIDAIIQETADPQLDPQGKPIPKPLTEEESQS